MKKELIEWAKALAIGIVVVLIVRIFLFSNYVVSGPSMMPTLEDRDRLVVNKIGYTIGGADRFDIIVFHANESDDYVKRVIGLPGDTIEYDDDQLFINGEVVEETFLTEVTSQLGEGEVYTPDFSFEDLQGTPSVVPEGTYFVMGDNRTNSTDSRIIGFVDQDSVVGTVAVRYWPFTDMTVNFND